jgi:hypothetical protein
MVTGLAKLLLKAMPVRSTKEQVVVDYRELLTPEDGCKSIT